MVAIVMIALEHIDSCNMMDELLVSIKYLDQTVGSILRFGMPGNELKVIHRFKNLIGNTIT